jgi:hypothetical protein
MMKNNAWLRGSGTGLAAIIRVDTKIGFLCDRQEGIDLAPAGPDQHPSYVWKRVFLRGRGQRG